MHFSCGSTIQDFHVDELISARYQEDNQLSVRKGFESAKADAFHLTSEKIRDYGRRVTGHPSVISGDSLL